MQTRDCRRRKLPFTKNARATSIGRGMSTYNPSSTSFFRSCLGVFQGGGCRTAAFVGAYREALERGVRFTEVAGTSAGSLIAALIGAGASPIQLEKLLENLNFSEFLVDVDREAKRGVGGGILSKFSPQWANLIFDKGFYSSRAIGSWLDTKLSELLPKISGPITFKDLPTTTHIVSTDINSSRVKIWNRILTPNEYVSTAVRASCSIPLFFQPVEKRHVDGGVISNLPAFVYSDDPSSLATRPLASRILAFSLEAEPKTAEEGSTISYLEKLVNVVIDGSQDLQLGMQRGVHVIRIPTGQIRATDFKKITKDDTKNLVENGKKATRQFFEEELIHIKTSNISPLCYGTEEVFTRITQNLTSDISEIVISEKDTNWVYSLFPSILFWRCRNIPIRVLLPTYEEKRIHGRYRRSLLRALGVQVTELAQEVVLPVRAFVFLTRDAAHLTGIIGVENTGGATGVEAVHYAGIFDSAAILAIKGQIENLLQLDDAAANGVPILERDTEANVVDRLRKVAQYSSSHVQLEEKAVSVNSLSSLAEMVREFKYNQIERLIDLYETFGLQLFEPARVRFSNGQTSIITPPVVEDAGGGNLLLLEGTTRATFCRENSIPAFRTILVKGVSSPLPASKVSFDRVRIVGRTLTVSQRYPSFNYQNFRHIEANVHDINKDLI